MKKLFFLSSLLLCVACSDQKPQVQVDEPDSLLSEQQMTDFLYDVQMLEGKIKALSVRHDSSKVLFDYYETKLYKKHGFSDSVYLESYTYYIEHPDKIKRIYDAVYDSLEQTEKDLKQKKLEEKKENK